MLKNNLIDRFLNNITMYRLVLYFLLVLLVAAFFLAFVGTLPFSPWALLFSTLLLIVVSLATNAIFARAFVTTASVESTYITALILALLITPQLTFASIGFMVWAAILSMASKYILAYKKRHLFNPAALAVVICALFINQSASWWVGTASLLPIVAIGGVLIVRKIRRADLVISFLITAILVTALLALISGQSLTTTLKTTLLSSSLFFLAFVMLTEPATTPPTHRQQITYGALVGFLFAPQLHLGSLYSTPELALLVGNIYAFLIGPKGNHQLRLQQITTAAQNTYQFIFTPDSLPTFQPGQYVELTVDTDPTDSRGNRRYFTIASSPTEKLLQFGVKFYPNPSAFKRSLANLKPGSRIKASAPAGTFVLPTNPNIKLAYIAGGIGVTPFRSHIKYLLDSQQRRDVVLFYSASSVEEFAYAPLFQEAQSIGLRTVYTISNPSAAPANWAGKTGFIDAQMIKETLPDYQERTFYLSGPNAMVVAFERILKELGVPKQNIKTDYFPGFA